MKRYLVQLGLIFAILAGILVTFTVASHPYVHAQQVPSSLSLSAPAPQGITQGSAGACSTCSGGGQSVYYYVIARFPAGLAFPVNGVITARNTAGIGNLSNTNFNVITWGGVSGATGYDVIRQATPGSPTSPCTGCVVTLNTGSTTVNDTGQNGGNYPPNLPSVSNTTGTFSIDNLNFLVPRLVYAVGGAPNYYAAMVLGTATAGQAAIFNSDGSISGGVGGGPATVAWGNITGTLSAQTDLQTALNAKVPTTTTVCGHALSTNVSCTASDVGLGNVTNDTQTKAAIVPNTVPTSGQMHVGNAGGTAFGVVSMSGDGTLANTGKMTLGTKFHTWNACNSGGLGDGLNAMGAGTYLQTNCYNTTGVTVILTGFFCLTLANGDFIKFTFVADGTSKQTSWVVTGTY
jgi:hypothetical protein